MRKSSGMFELYFVKQKQNTLKQFNIFQKMKIPLAKRGERRRISTRPLALASGRALKENHVAW